MMRDDEATAKHPRDPSRRELIFSRWEAEVQVHEVGMANKGDQAPNVIRAHDIEPSNYAVL